MMGRKNVRRLVRKTDGNLDLTMEMKMDWNLAYWKVGNLVWRTVKKKVVNLDRPKEKTMV